MSKSRKRNKKLEPIIEDSSLEDTSISVSDEEIIIEDDEEGGIIIEEDTDQERDYYLSKAENSSSSFSSELRLLENIILKGEKYSIYEIAMKTDTPEKFIFRIDGELVSVKLKIQNNKSIIENYDYFYSRGIKITPSDFIMVFYIANSSKDKDYLIENFNYFKDISGKKEPYFVEAFEDYVTKFRNYYDFLMKTTKKNFENFEKFYSKVDQLKASQDINKIIDSFIEESTEIEINITDDNYPFNKENGKYIFNKLQVTKEFPFIKLIINGKSLYKIYTHDDNLEDYIEQNEEVEENDNKLYIYYSISIDNKIYKNKISIDLETSKMLLNYPSNGLNIMKEKISEFYPTIKFESYEEKNMTGEFEILFKGYDETKFYYLTLFDPIFSEFFFVRELSTPRSLKENIKFYYVGTEEVRDYTNYSIYFNINKLQGDKYVINFSSKKHSPSLIKEFMVILSKIIYYYQDPPMETMIKYDIVTKPYTGIDGEGLGGKEEDRIISEKQKSKKKIYSLVVKNKKLFSKNYYARSCPCQKQPVIISEEDKEDWQNYTFEGKKRNVVLFPPENSTQRATKEYYVCPDDEYQTLTLRQNPDSSSEYPLIPCCNISNFPEDLYADYDKIRANPSKYWLSREEFRGKGKGILKTNKILSTERLGYLPEFVEKFMREIDNRKFIREGIFKNSKSSLLHIMFKTYPDVSKLISIKNKNQNLQYRDIMNNYKTYMKFDTLDKDIRYVKKNTYINFIRSQIPKEYLVKEISSQETFKFNKDETIELFSFFKNTLESQYFYKVLEIIFCVNIFVFVFDKEKDKTYLETPENSKYHIREVREDLPSILILKHIRRNSHNVYELIRTETNPMEETKSLYVFPTKFTKYLKNYFLNKAYYTIDSFRKEVSQTMKKDYSNLVRKNPYSYINWNKILRDYNIVSQMINSNGRCYAFNLEYAKGKIMTLFVEPTFPFNVKESDQVEKASKKDIIKLFGNNYSNGEDGIWYPLNNLEKGFFVPCKEACTGGKKCREFILITSKTKVDRTYENIKICKKNSIIFIQVFRWLYLLENIDYDEWKEKYMIRDKKLSSNTLTENYLNISYRFPQNIKTTQEGITYLNKYSPKLFNNNKIYLYPELYDSIDRNMLNYLHRYEGLEIINNSLISNVYNNLDDFDRQKFTKLIMGEDKYRLWKNNYLVEDINRNDIYEEEDINKELPFVWRNVKNGAIYFVQNNKNSSKITSMINSLFWSLFGNNSGYDMTITNIWKLFYNMKPNILNDYFGWNNEIFKNYIKEKTNKEVFFMKSNEYINFLIQNRIPYMIKKEYSYIVYSKVGEKINVTEKYIIDKRPPLELYRYDEGGYASLLDLV